MQRGFGAACGLAARAQSSRKRPRNEKFFIRKNKVFIEALVRSPCHKRYFGDRYLCSFVAGRLRLLYAGLLMDYILEPVRKLMVGISYSGRIL